MKKCSLVLLIIVMVFAGSVMLSESVLAGVNVNVGINLPAFEFHAPPEVVVVPGTYVYTVPDADIDIVFYQGYWYRPYRDHWYRSASYNGPWRHLGRERVPGALLELPSDYRHVPPGHERIPYGHLKKNWKNWEKEKYWDRHEYKHAEKERRKEEKHEQKREEKGEHKRGGRDRQDN